MQSVLVCQELWTITSGELVKPEVIEGDGSALAAWLQKDQKAKATIILSITPMQILHIKNATSAKAAWDTLSDIHKPRGPARKVTLFKMLSGMRMSDSEIVQQYVCKFCAVADKLAEVGIELQGESLVIMLLASLPKAFESLVVALESRDELPTLDAVKVKLIEEGDRRKECNADAYDNGAQAFMLHEHKRNDNTVDSKTKRETYNKQVKCYNCGRKGHFRNQCRFKKNNSNKNNENAVFAGVGHGSSNALNKILNENVWCIDRGAMSHLCCKKEMFTKLHAYEEEIMLAGESKNIKVNNVDVT